MRPSPTGGEGRPPRTAPGLAEPWWLIVVVGATLLGALVVFAHANIPYTGFWYDEAVQFWIARGVDPFSEPLTPSRGLAAVIWQNGRANLDPAGFGLVLRGWMAGGTGPAWLRALPFALFLAGLGAMARLGWACRPSPLFALFGAAVPLAYPLLLYHATELRAYTTEFAGVAVGSLLLHRLGTKLTAEGLELTGIVLAVFMGSRYSYSIFAGAVCLALARAIWSSTAGDPQAQHRRLAALGVPVLGGAIFVATSLWLQRGRLAGSGGAYVQYLSGSTAAGKSPGELATLLMANLLSPVAIPLTLAAVVALMPSRWRARCPSGLFGIGATPEARLVYRLAPGVLALSAAVWRWHPWDANRKWSLFLQAVSAVMVMRLVADVWLWLDARDWTGPRVRATRTAILALVVVGLGLHASTERRTHEHDLTAVLAQLERESLGPESVAVGVHPFPALRYFCEYGPFVGRLPYPGAFRLPSWGGPKPVIGPRTRYLIAYEPSNELALLHPGSKLRADPSWPVHLYAVEPAAVTSP
jgi:hypothetical protein